MFKGLGRGLTLGGRSGLSSRWSLAARRFAIGAMLSPCVRGGRQAPCSNCTGISTNFCNLQGQVYPAVSVAEENPSTRLVTTETGWGMWQPPTPSAGVRTVRKDAPPGQHSQDRVLYAPCAVPATRRRQENTRSTCPDPLTLVCSPCAPARPPEPHPRPTPRAARNVSKSRENFGARKIWAQSFSGFSGQWLKALAKLFGSIEKPGLFGGQQNGYNLVMYIELVSD